MIKYWYYNSQQHCNYCGLAGFSDNVAMTCLKIVHKVQHKPYKQQQMTKLTAAAQKKIGK